MAKWHNWSGRLTARPQSLQFIRSEADAQALAASATANGRTLRTAGATHSHAPLVQHDDIIVDLSGLSGVISTDPQANTAWVRAGSRIYALGRPLHDAGLALSNQGDIDQQAIAGATATGTHGTGVTLRNLSAAVVGARMVLADGTMVIADAEQNSTLWEASRLHLGAFGIITELNLQLEPAYRLEERGWQAPLEQVMADLPELVAENRHCEFFWYPQTDTANAKVINTTAEQPRYPMGEEGTRLGWSYEVLPNHRPDKHTEMEYSVPFENGPACMRDIQALLNNEFKDVRWPVEYRTLAADDVWLSTAYQRQTVTISVHQDVREDETSYYQACEEIFLCHHGIPHWGKVNYLDHTQLDKRHPRWSDWWRVRDEHDPKGTFLNDYLRSIRPS